jgi:hypothetical protein
MGSIPHSDIIKASDPSGIIEIRQDWDSNHGYTSAYEIRPAIKTELDLLDEPLLHLQGTVASQVYERYVTKKPGGKTMDDPDGGWWCSYQACRLSSTRRVSSVFNTITLTDDQTSHHPKVH